MKPTSRRAIRAQRKAKEEVRQYTADDWLGWECVPSSMPPEVESEFAHLTLTDGTSVDPREGWVIPQQKGAK